MGRTSRIALVTLVTATVLAGCGGGGGGGGEVPEIEGVPPEQVEAVTEQVEAAANFCEAAKANVDAGAAFNEFVRAGEAPRPAEEIEAVVQPLRDSNAQMIETAEDERLRADLELISAAQEVSLAVFESTAGDAAAAASDPAFLQKAEEAETASAEVRQHVRTYCRIAPN